MSDVSLSGFSGTLQNMIEEQVGAILCVDPETMPQLEEGETALIRIFGPATNEVLRVKMTKGLYVAIERGMQRTKASCHPTFACVEGLSADYNACALALMLCSDPEALAGLAMCLDTELKIEEQFTQLMTAAGSRDELLSTLQNELSSLKTEFSNYKSSSEANVTELLNTVQIQADAIATAQQCADQNKNAIVGINEQINTLTGQVTAALDGLSTIQQWINSFNINDYITSISTTSIQWLCGALNNANCMLAADDNSGGGSGGGNEVTVTSCSGTDGANADIVLSGPPGETLTFTASTGATESVAFDASGVGYMTLPASIGGVGGSWSNGTTMADYDCAIEPPADG